MSFAGNVLISLHCPKCVASTVLIWTERFHA